VRRCVLAKDT